MVGRFPPSSIGAVVLGGTLIFGGSATALGTLFGSLLLVLIVTTMQIAGLPPGTQNVVQGVVIIAVLVLAAGLQLGRRPGLLARLFPKAGRLPKNSAGS